MDFESFFKLLNGLVERKAGELKKGNIILRWQFQTPCTSKFDMHLPLSFHSLLVSEELLLFLLGGWPHLSHPSWTCLANYLLPESFICPSAATSILQIWQRWWIWVPTICQLHDDLSALSWLTFTPTQQSMRYLLHLEIRKLRLQGILCYSFPNSSNCQVMKLGLTSGSSASSTSEPHFYSGC